MENEPNRLTDSNQSARPQRKWYKIEVLRELVTNVPLTTARARIESAFASNIAISKGFLLASYKYSGRFDGNNLDIDFTVSRRSQMNYKVTGQIFEDANGSKLQLKITVKNPLVLVLVFFLFPLIVSRNIVTIITMMCVLVPLTFAVMYWHCNEAANSMTDMLNRIIYGQPYR